MGHTPQSNEKKADKSTRFASTNQDEPQTAADLEHAWEIRFRLGSDDASSSGEPGAIDAASGAAVQANVPLPAASSLASPAAHTPPEQPLPATRLQDALPLSPAGERHWQFEIVGDRLPISSLLIQRIESQPLQVSLQGPHADSSKPSAWSVQRLRERLALQGARLTEREESDAA
jgi:hypothetical protein